MFCILFIEPYTLQSESYILNENHSWFWNINKNTCRKRGYSQFGNVIVGPFFVNDEKEE